jgi:hypothetical protein
MKTLFFLLAFMGLFSCGSSTFNCGTIDSKYEKDGKYYFSLVLSGTGSGDQGDAGRIYGDVSVEKTVYLLKSVGEEYCIEEE